MYASLYIKLYSLTFGMHITKLVLLDIYMHKPFAASIAILKAALFAGTLVLNIS